MILSAGELAARIGAELHGDPSLPISGVATIDEAGQGHVTFLTNPSYRKYLASTGASAVIVAEHPDLPGKTWLVAKDPRAAFIEALHCFFPPIEGPAPGVHPTAVVAPGAKIASDATIGPLCVIEEGVEIGSGTFLRAQAFVGRNVVIGENCLIHSRVSIREGCRIGNRVTIQDGAVIGSDGFGFAPGQEGYATIPQVGIVVIEDNVDIGANTTIDRATLTRTVIRKGVKLDNLIQIAHNVEVGLGTVMAAQTGIAGSTKVGAHSMFGGQVGVAGHLKLEDALIVAAQSGVTSDPKSVERRDGVKIVGGSPARDIHHWRRIEASLSRLPELFKRVKKLEDKG